MCLCVYDKLPSIIKIIKTKVWRKSAPENNLVQISKFHFFLNLLFHKNKRVDCKMSRMELLHYFQFAVVTLKHVRLFIQFTHQLTTPSNALLG